MTPFFIHSLLLLKSTDKNILLRPYPLWTLALIFLLTYLCWFLEGHGAATAPHQRVQIWASVSVSINLFQVCWTLSDFLILSGFLVKARLRHDQFKLHFLFFLYLDLLSFGLFFIVSHDGHSSCAQYRSQVFVKECLDFICGSFSNTQRLWSCWLRNESKQHIAMKTNKMNVSDSWIVFRMCMHSLSQLNDSSSSLSLSISLYLSLKHTHTHLGTL